MKYACPRPLLEALKAAALTPLLALLFAAGVAAQPGYVPTVEELQKQLQPSFDELARQIKDDPRRASPYLGRSALYVALYERARHHGRDGSAFAERALADLSNAVGLSPTREAYDARSRLYLALATAKGYPEGVEASRRADLQLTFSRFGAAESDLLQVLRLSDGDAQLTDAHAALGRLLSTRATFMSTPAAVAGLRSLGVGYSAWDDFDRAAAYTKEWMKRAPTKAGEWPLYNEENLVGIYMYKGAAAYRLGEDAVALAAFGEGEQYLTEHYFWRCNYYAGWGDAFVRERRPADAIRTYTKGIGPYDWPCRRLLERRADVYFAEGELRKALRDYDAFWETEEPCCRGRLALKRAKVYLKLNEPGEAVGVLTSALEKTVSSTCPQIYLLRAEAFKMLGNTGRAAADEREAERFKALACGDLDSSP